MKKIFIKRFNELLILKDEIIDIVIEDVLEYRELIFSIYDNIIFSENNNIYDNKVILVINNLFSLDINDKKNINYLYKSLLYNIKDDIKQKICLVESNIIDILEDLTYESDYNIKYNEELDLTKLLSIYQVSFSQENKNNYLEYFLDYVKINVKINNYKLIISFGLLDLLTCDEIDLLKKELLLLDINLLNISIKNSNYVKPIFVYDKDKCVI